MRIGLSCTAEGFGHASRLTAMAQEFQGRHEVTYFVHPRLKPFIEENLPGAGFFEIPYFSFVLENDRVRYDKTLIRNLPLFFKMRRIVGDLAERIKSFGLDGVVSDYDPFLAGAAKKLGIPVIQINHPSVVLRDRSLTPGAWLARAGAGFLERPNDLKLVCSFYNGDVGPMIRKKIRDLTPVKGDRYLVYLNGNHRNEVRRKLDRIGLSRVEYFPDPEKDFLSAFASAKGVICTAGHQIITEAVYLGKPLFLIPQRGQFEQELNARMLESSGWGMRGTMETLDALLPRFVERIDSFGFRPKRKDVRFDFSDHTFQVISLIEQYFSLRFPAPSACPADRKISLRRNTIPVTLSPAARN